MSGEVAEVLLKGSELDKYLQKYCDEPHEVFTQPVPQCMDYSQSDADQLELKEKCSAERSKLIGLLFKSGLMLEEDAAWLASVVDHQEHHTSERIPVEKYLKTIMPMSLATVCSWLMWRPKNHHLTGLLASSGFIINAYFIYRLVRSSSEEKEIRSLITITEGINSFLTHFLRNLKDLMATVSAKDFLNTDGNCGPHIFYCERARTELKLWTEEMLQIVFSLIRLNRKTTVRVVQETLDSENPALYLAFSPESDLNLDKYGSFRTEVYSDLDKLYSTYLLLTSECLRTIGLSLFRGKTGTRLLRIVAAHNKVAANLGLSVKKRYHLKLRSLPDETHPVKKTKGENDRIFMAVHKFRTYLSSLQTYADTIENILDNEIIEPKNVKILDCNLASMESELMDCSTIIRGIRTMICIHSENKDVQTKHPPISPSPTEASEVTPPLKIRQTEEKRSSLDNLDRVFIGAVDEHRETLTGENYCDDELPIPTYPNNLLSELKMALVPKRHEFVEREKIAALRDGDLDSYIEIEESLEKENLSPRKEHEGSLEKKHLTLTPRNGCLSDIEDSENIKTDTGEDESFASAALAFQSFILASGTPLQNLNSQTLPCQKSFLSGDSSLMWTTCGNEELFEDSCEDEI